MASGKSNFLENEILDHILSAATYTAPATMHVSLHTASVTDAGTGTEVSGGSYARVAVTNNATNWPAASGGSKSSGADFNFPTPSAGWGTVTSMGMWDASSGGNLLYWGDLTTNKTINTGDTVRFATGSIVVTED